MARFVWYRCPDCGGKFKHLHHPSESPPPDRCALCHSWMSDDEPPQEVFVPQAPRIAKSDYAKSIEQTYRASETASIHRANEAADQLEAAYRKEDRESPFEGDPRILAEFHKNQIAEMKSGIKVTNMKDPTETRPGDTSFAGATAHVAGAGFKDLSGQSARAVYGAGQNAAFVARATSDHTQRAQSMIRAGMIAKH